MQASVASPFTPALERARHDELVRRVREGTLRAPVWLLCSHAALRASREDRVARAGGAFARFYDWDHLLRALEDLLDLPVTRTPDETERALAVERCLDAHSSAHPDLADPLRSDPFGVAMGLLRVVDTLRLHRWNGSSPPPATPSDEPASRLIASHVELLGDLLRELETQLVTSASLDLIGRMQRVLDPLKRVEKLPVTRLLVDGVDRLAPLERDLLLALRNAGATVDVAPWVEGWSEAADPAEDVPAKTADATFVAVAARDPHEEAELVARWIAEQVAVGADPEDFAVHVSAEAGAIDRLRRALARYDVASSGVGATPVRQSVPWQVLRASVRLGWQGVDVVDLATVLSAPGSGVWGSDRDWLCARLRQELPTTWKGVREVLNKATELAVVNPSPAALFEDDAFDTFELEEEPAVPATDPARKKQLDKIRESVGALITLWDSEGPFSRRPAPERLGALTRIVKATLARFMDTMRYPGAINDPRTQTAWIGAAQRITAACEAALQRLERSNHLLPPHAPGAFLAATESLLGATLDAPMPAHGEGVALLVEHAFPQRRPRVLVVTGFHRGRFPSHVATPLVLGALERESLGASGPDLGALPSEAELGALAQRETRRVLTLPVDKLVLVATRRTSSGSEVGVALAWHDLLATLPADEREARERRGVPSMRAWLREQSPGASNTPRARTLDAIASLGAGRVDDAIALGAPVAVGSQAARDLFMARFRPEMRFEVGDLVQAQLTTAVLSPHALETMLKCRYSFLTGTLLGLKPLGLARSPSIGSRDITRVTRAALKSLDGVAATGRAPTEADLPGALQEAIEAEIPWAGRADLRLALEDLTRTVEGFLRRYIELRGAWKLDFANDVPPRDDAGPVVLAVPSKLLPSVSLSPVKPRVEVLRATGPQGEELHSLVMDLKLGTTASMTKLRDAGLDMYAALVPKMMDAQRGDGREVAAFVRLSLAKPDGELIARTGTGPNKDPYESVATATLVTVDRARPLERLADGALRQIGVTFDSLLEARGSYAPHDEARRAELVEAGAKSCEYCSMKLGCRFQMAGGER